MQLRVLKAVEQNERVDAIERQIQGGWYQCALPLQPATFMQLLHGAGLLPLRAASDLGPESLVQGPGLRQGTSPAAILLAGPLQGALPLDLRTLNARMHIETAAEEAQHGKSVPLTFEAIFTATV